jgi:hypothetical protein
VSDDVVQRVVGAAGQATVDVPIPNDAALVGVRFHHQALVPDPAGNPFGAVVSDAMAAVVGGR